MHYHICATYHQDYCVDGPVLLSSDQWLVAVGTACVTFVVVFVVVFCFFFAQSNL